MMQDLQLGEIEEEHRRGYAQVAIVNQKTRLLLDHLRIKITTQANIEMSYRDFDWHNSMKSRLHLQGCPIKVGPLQG